MKFKRLRLQGFKSFCDPTDLLLEPGLTGVVGPNGCGKSNLVEALRWVMGESSYKAMRASGMDDVIFSGSANRPERNSAEVTLVLDNSDRKAPSPFNDADILEVTRRIERENGSVYRLNGREMRARDVQLLFADASTGAHSPALVRQGQIGELIAAKPVKRRALLEEAAGISGLHSRRHEAELRLRGAEQNIERVEDIVAQVEGQLDSLKKQARQAVRYRNVSGDIRKAEATLYHVRWVAARVAEHESLALQGQLITRLAQANHQHLESGKAREAAEHAQSPLRETDVSAGATVQRLKILREQLEGEIQRSESRLKELLERQRQIISDQKREVSRGEEASEMLGAYVDEKTGLLEETRNQIAAATDARETAKNTEAVLKNCEMEHARLRENLAQMRAQRIQTERTATDAEARKVRLQQQIDDVESEATNVRAELDADQKIVEIRLALEQAHLTSKNLERETLTAETASAEAQMKLEAARPELAELTAALNRMESEAETLADVLNLRGDNLWPAIVDVLKVTPGYEVALGAALGDDLDASSDNGAPKFWHASGSGDADPDLPSGAVALSNFVTGSEILKRTLDQIGVIQGKDGERLSGQLQPGQRLITLEGDLWRWDGLVSKADAPNAAAQRLSQRNRLADLDLETRELRNRLEKHHKSLASLKELAQHCQKTDRQLRDQWRIAQKNIGEAQNVFDVAQRAAGDLATRQSALEEARVRLRSSLVEAGDVAADARQSLKDMGLESAAERDVELAQNKLKTARDDDERARLKLGSVENLQQTRATRISQLEAEIDNWTRRKLGALAQADDLQHRAAQISEQLGDLEQSPHGFSQRRKSLDLELENAVRLRKAASDNLERAQTVYREADRANRSDAQKLGDVRAEMARNDERLKGLAAQRQQIEQTIEEGLGISADETARTAGIKPEAALPDEHLTEKRVERLKAERERLGGVNLSAEKEAEEVKEKLATMIADRDDLTAAISKLRTGISSLNREGRARLNAAFDKVNAHFQELFTSLFGGGTAQLTFVESDDPLEAGLEIVARPPGKKPQVLSLLSGGEQALTALALIFAVFLTNPAPICVLDEVDAPLDDANVERFCALLDSMCTRTETRFLVITHNPITMSRVDRLFGVTMAERGVSQLVSVDLATAQSHQEAAS